MSVMSVSRGAQARRRFGSSTRAGARCSALSVGPRTEARKSRAAGRPKVSRPTPLEVTLARGGASRVTGAGARGVTIPRALSGGATNAHQVLWSNTVFKAGFMAWIAAQVLKILTSYLTTRRLDWRPLFDSGGMPSSHSSLCMAVTTAVGIIHGLGSSLFPVCLGFSAIVMYDAANVRLQAGKHAQILNKVVEKSGKVEKRET